jgi:hypothetical protein
MHRRDFIRRSIGAAAATQLPRGLFGQTSTGSGVAVTTRAADNTRSGSYYDTVLNQSSIVSRGLRKYFTLPLEGDARGAEAQPLFVPAVKTDDGVVRDVCIVASMNNTVWAYDANSSDILWVKKLAIPVKGDNSIDMYVINDHWGLLSTGVIDPETLIWYGVALSSPDQSPKKGEHAVHSLDIRTGRRVHPPVSLKGVTYQPPRGLPLQSYGAAMRKQRSSLVMTNVRGVKTIFFGAGTVLETENGAAGWVMAYDVAENTISAAIALSAGTGAGLWMAGSGLCADEHGYLYGTTGNGSFDPIHGADFGETMFKLEYRPPYAGKKGTLEVIDWWTPYTDAGKEGEDPTLTSPSSVTPKKMSGVSEPTSAGHMPTNMASERSPTGQVIAGHLVTKPTAKGAGFGDEDLGSAGCFIVPQYGVMASGGKDGILYEANMYKMGKTLPGDFANAAANYAKLKQPPVWFTFFPGFNVNPAPQDPSDLDFLYDNKTRHMHSTPVHFMSETHGMMVFCWGENSNLRAWSMAPTGALTFLAQGTETASAQIVNAPGGMPGGFMCVSSDKGKAGTPLLWATIPYGDANKSVTQGRLLCYDAENFIANADGSKQLKVLWDSEKAGAQFKYAKFTPPVVYEGKVFVVNYDGSGVDVYGLA